MVFDLPVDFLAIVIEAAKVMSMVRVVIVSEIIKMFDSVSDASDSIITECGNAGSGQVVSQVCAAGSKSIIESADSIGFLLQWSVSVRHT